MLSTLVVYVDPTVAGDGTVDLNVKVWLIFATVTVCESEAGR